MADEPTLPDPGDLLLLGEMLHRALVDRGNYVAGDRYGVTLDGMVGGAAPEEQAALQRVLDQRAGTERDSDPWAPARDHPTGRSTGPHLYFGPR